MTNTTTRLTSAGKEITLDQYQRRVISERDICDVLYCNPEIDISEFELEDPTQHNSAVTVNYSELSLIKQLEEISEDPETWHHQNQNTWLMPSEYKTFNLHAFLMSQCSTNEQIQRMNQEFLEFEKRGLLDLLRYIKYLVDTMTKHNVIWGIGRGSSVASYVLYLIGIHSVDSIKHDLDFYEFMR